MKSSQVNRRLLPVLLFVGIGTTSQASLASFEIEGFLRGADDQVLGAQSVKMWIKVRKAGDTSCNLYSEYHSAVSVNALGSFLAKVGTGVPNSGFNSASTGISDFDDYFSNPDAILCRNLDGTLGSGSAVVGDERELAIEVELSNNERIDAGVMSVAAVPVANRAKKIGKHDAGSLMRVENDGRTAPEAVASLKISDFNELLALIGGTSTKYVGPNSSQTAAVDKGGTGLSTAGASNQILGMKTDASGMSYKTVSGSNGITVTHADGSIVINGPTGFGTVTSVSVPGTSPLSVTSGTTTPQLSISKADAATSGYISAADWNSFNSKQAAGTYLTSISSNDVQSALGFSPTNPANQVLIGGNGNAFSMGTTGAHNLTFISSGSPRMTLQSDGNVGIGTASPAAKLHVEGKIRAQEICDTAGANCKVISSGWTAGSLTSVSVGGLPLSVANGSTSPQISIAQATSSAAGYLTSADWTSFNNKQPAGSYLTSIAAGHVTTALGFTPLSPTLAANMVLIGNGANVAAAGFFGIGQMRNSVGAAQFPTACAASETLTWTAVTDVLICSSIGSLPASAITTGTIDSARLPFGAGLWQDGGAGKVYYSGGNVGIGTTTPGAKLDVNGIVRATEICDEAGANCKDISTGWGTGGAVTSIATGTGLTGGTITASGTISLAAIADDTVLANVSGASAAPSSTTITSLIDNSLGNTQGSILFRNAAAWVPLTPGTSGHVLKTQGPTANPIWGPDTNSGGTVTNVSVGGLPLSVTNGTTTPTISIAPASSTTAGFVTAADWNLFNSKQPAGAYLTSISAAQVQTALGFTPLNRAGGSMTGLLTLPSNGILVGTNQLVVSSGNVGIGLTGPNHKLEVSGTSAVPSLSADNGIFQINMSSSTALEMGSSPSSPFAVWMQTKRSTNDGTSWPFSLNPLGGNVGIGTTNPRAKLDVQGGAIVGAANTTVSAFATIDFGEGNLMSTPDNCRSFTLHNLKNGGVFNLLVRGTASAECTFNAFSDSGGSALTIRLPPGHGFTISGKKTLYSFMVVGAEVFVTWIPGYD